MYECVLYIVSPNLVCCPPDDRPIVVERSARWPAFCLQRTELFSVHCLAPPGSIGCASQNDNDLAAEISSCVKQTAKSAENEVHAAALPRLPIRDLLSDSGKEEFLRLIKKHSFMILTGMLHLKNNARAHTRAHTKLSMTAAHTSCQS